jgi:hypothetical protein
LGLFAVATVSEDAGLTDVPNVDQGDATAFTAAVTDPSGTRASTTSPGRITECSPDDKRPVDYHGTTPRWSICTWPPKAAARRVLKAGVDGRRLSGTKTAH